MWTFKAVVVEGVMRLPDGVHLPDGTVVEVLVPQSEEDIRRAFERVLKNRIRHDVGIDEIIEEDKRERESRWDKGNDQ